MSIAKLLRSINLGKAFQVFPLASILSIILSGFVIWLSHSDGNPQPLIFKTLAAGYISFLTAVATPAITDHWQHSQKIIVNLICPLLVGIIAYFLIPAGIFDNSAITGHRFSYQYPAWVMIFHLCISFGPYLFQSGDRDFWEYNTRLLTSFTESLFFSLVLFLGLSLAILALDHLFGLTVNGKIYSHLALILFGVFHSFYFLSKFPKPNYNNQISPSSKPYQVLIYYILGPIVMVYLVILYAYGAKLGFSWLLPQGWLGTLSLCFSAVGLLTYLMGYHLSTSTPVKRLSKSYKDFLPIALIIPSILLIIAIYRRLEDYGITEERYIVALAALWLLVFAIVKIIVPSLSIKWVPISLSIITAFALLAGPWGMFGSTVSSQSERLRAKLISEGLLVDQKLIPYEEGKQGITNWSELYFLEQRSDFDFLNDWIAPNIDLTDTTLIGNSSNGEWFRNYLGINKGYRGEYEEQMYFNYNALPSGRISLEGHEELTYFSSYQKDSSTAVTKSASAQNLEFHIDNNQVEISTKDILAQWKDLDLDQAIEQKDLCLKLEIDGKGIQVFFSHISIRMIGHKTYIDDYTGFILY